MNTLWKAGIVLWPLIVAALALRLVGQTEPEAATDTLKIAVVDRDAIALALAEQKGPEGAIRAADGIAERLAAEGYVVLDQRYVLRAPPAAVVRP